VPAISVLLVEDEALISMMVSDALSEVGFAVYEAATAEEALRYIGSGGAVDVLFTDINLPGGMSGTELAQAVRALKPDLRVVYASGRYRHDDLPDRVPDSLFVQKPYDLDRLCALLAGHTAGTPPEHRAAELIPAEA
jgi:CheY-like chemotaxis protein